MSREMKNSGQVWIGEIPSNWNVLRIKHTSWLKGRIGWDGLKAEEFQDDGPFLITGTDFQNGKINWSTCAHITEERFNEDELLHIQEGDLLITKDGTIGKLAIVEGCPEKVSLNSGVMIIRNNTAWKYDKKYMYYILDSDIFIQWFESEQKPGSTIKHLYQHQFGEFQFPLPGMYEQHAIVRYLDSKCSAIDEAIERHKKIIEKLEEYRTASITSAVTRSKTAIHYKPSKTYAREIPDYWEETNLGNLVYSMRNGYVGPTRDILVDEGVRYIQSLHVKNGRLFFENGPFYVTEMWGNVHPKIKTGDLLIVQTGDIGQVAVVTEEYNGCNCHALIIARTRTDIILPEYLAYYCRSRVGLTELLLTATGATLPHLNSGAIKYSTVIIPPIAEQKEIIDSLHEIEASIDKHIEVHESIITKLEEYRKSIIYNAVTGKIDCREV